MTDGSSSTPKLSTFAFVLGVQDLERSTAYYRDVLGFTVAWAEADDWRLAERDGVRFMMGHCPDTPPARDIGDHSWIAYLHVDDVDALHTELASRGAVCTRPVDRPYGQREIMVTTPDGHRIMIGQILRRP